MPGGRDNSGMRYAGLGFELVAAVGGMTLLGWWIDRQFGTAPWGILVGAIVGLIGGMYNLVHAALAAIRPASPADGSRRERPPADGPRQGGGSRQGDGRGRGDGPRQDGGPGA